VAFSQHGTSKLVFKGIVQVQGMGLRDPTFGEVAAKQRYRQILITDA
jgi:hypothetical protein